jgi:hypothetical protein
VLFRAMGLIVRVAPRARRGRLYRRQIWRGLAQAARPAGDAVLRLGRDFALGVLSGVMAFAGLNIFKLLFYVREELTLWVIRVIFDPFARCLLIS